MSHLFTSLELRSVVAVWVASESLPGMDIGELGSQMECVLGIGS